MSLSNFQNWFDEQLQAGLVDIKLAINAGKDISSEAVQEEILAAEAAIASKFFRCAPSPLSTTPAEVAQVINNSKAVSVAA